MITNSIPNCQIPVNLASQHSDINTPHVSTWQQELSNSIQSLDVLLSAINLSPEQLEDAYENANLAAQQFAIRVPKPFVQRMKKGDPHDPLLRQVLPIGKELTPVDGFSHDPLNELANIPQPGVIHKYAHRALLITGQSCAVNCRYCFRRHFPYSENQLSHNQWHQTMSYLEQHDEINEVILSGGDPLANNDRTIEAQVRALSELSHIKRLRVHTRLPIVIPQRISKRLLSSLSLWRKQLIMVIHCNHANEIDQSVSRALKQMKDTNFTLLNQSVLLRGVNDKPQSLVALSEKLFEQGVMPYYLHLLDRVAGSTHFAIDDNEAQQLMGEVSSALPGYLVPRLVRDVAGKPAKVPMVPIF